MGNATPLTRTSASSYMSSAGFLVGKLALVTGGSGTIGQAIARSLVSRGTSVILTARRREKLETARDEIVGGLTAGSGPPGPEPGEVYVIPSDVSNEKSVVDLFEEIDGIGDGGGVDLLVNNAGTSGLPPFSSLGNSCLAWGTNASRSLALRSIGRSQESWRPDPRWTSPPMTCRGCYP